MISHLNAYSSGEFVGAGGASALTAFAIAAANNPFGQTSAATGDAWLDRAYALYVASTWYLALLLFLPTPLPLDLVNMLALMLPSLSFMEP